MNWFSILIIIFISLSVCFILFHIYSQILCFRFPKLISCCIVWFDVCCMAWFASSLPLLYRGYLANLKREEAVSLLTDRTNKVQIGSSIYSTLHDVPVDYWDYYYCVSWAVMPSDWVFAPDNAASRSVAATYTWYSNCVVLAGGGSEYSRHDRQNYGAYGSCGSWTVYNQNGNQYKPSACYLQLLILQ